MSDEQETLFEPPEPDLRPWQHSAGPFDLEKGKERRDEGMARVLSHTPAEWRRAFELAFRDLVRAGRDLTAEDVTARVGMPPDGVNPNAVGAEFRSLCVRYRLQKVGRVKASRVSRHANEIVVWGRR